jgi:hypothetical protein
LVTVGNANEKNGDAPVETKLDTVTRTGRFFPVCFGRLHTTLLSVVQDAGEQDSPPTETNIDTLEGPKLAPSIVKTPEEAEAWPLGEIEVTEGEL